MLNVGIEPTICSMSMNRSANEPVELVAEDLQPDVSGITASAVDRKGIEPFSSLCKSVALPMS